MAKMMKVSQQVDKKSSKSLAKQLFFKKSAEQYGALQQDKNEWNDYLAELKEWDIALRDGLEDE